MIETVDSLSINQGSKNVELAVGVFHLKKKLEQ